ncbi:LuxR family maltose regulon positive regulatory protein [Scopulibacillus darangshiensis]|uniref:LuxR family maltose regulon positive regulatory protein n=1 Tax=Scopulibacillus darangshiensis TaxID=442528 RepID=A0A4R2PAF1_9BACL|nr:tetratricopeptide repeat protein [Scopulibacillus darangshiensis]TCP30875.1 LuxR family maltose regulon positive regulatory protein [Scopulibacillus darangshiensis]
MEINQSKLTIPHYMPYLKRNRLFSKLDNNGQATVISISGDSGYGKTTLISSYIHEKSIPTVWYQLESTDRYSHIFLTYLKTGICNLINDDYLPPGSIQPNDADKELDNLVSLLSKRIKPLFIVLDDYQWVDQSPEIKPIIRKMLLHASPEVTFIIISRVRPNLPLVKMRRRYIECHSSDLAFTPSETDKFFNAAHHLNLENHEIQFIHETTEGWVASYQLILGIIGNMSKSEREFFWAKFPNVSDIYDYLSLEVLETQSEEIKSFLYKTSLMSELDPSIIDNFLGIDHSEKIINYLLTQHLFIYRDEQGTIRYHRLFRRFLYQKAKEQFGNASVTKDHLMLAEIYLEMDQYVHAFAYFIIGKDYPNAAKVMEMIRNRYNPVELIIFLDGWLEEISPGLSLANNTLFLIRCIPLSIVKDLIVSFEREVSRLKERKNLLWLCSMQHRLATILFMRGDITVAKKLFSESLEGSKKFHDYPIAALNLTLLAEIDRYLGNPQAALRSVRESLFISEKHHIKHTQLHALDTIATIYLDEKKVDEAERYIEQALQIANKYDLSSQVFVYTTMSRMLRVKGDLRQSITWGKKAAGLAQNYNSDFDIGWSNLELAQSFLDHQQWEDAEHCLMKALHAFSLFSYYRCMVVRSQIDLYQRKGDRKREAQKHTEWQQICEDKGYEWLVNKKKLKGTASAGDEPNQPLVIHVLGSFQIAYQNKPVTIKRKSSLRLLQYFITHRDKKINKDILLDAVFPDGSPDAIQNQFHVSLSTLRKSLEPELKSGAHSKFITRVGDHYYFDTERVYLDAEEFLQLSGSEMEGRGDASEKLFKADQLYQGDYFEEYPYDAFLESERKKMRFLFIKNNRLLAQHYRAQGEYFKCFGHLEKILNNDPYHEQTYLEYIELLLEQNLHSKANTVANEMIKYLEKELGIKVQDHLLKLFSTFRCEITI